MLLQVAKHLCPDAVPQIERAVRLCVTIKVANMTSEEKATSTERPAEAFTRGTNDRRRRLEKRDGRISS